MYNTPFKVCPICNQRAAMHMQKCGHCGHRFPHVMHTVRIVAAVLVGLMLALCAYITLFSPRFP